MPVAPWPARIVFRMWLLALAACTALVLIGVFFIDRPLALFVNTLPWNSIMRAEPLTLPILVALAGLVIAACGAVALSGHRLSHWIEPAMLSALSLICGVFVSELLLKPLFGRYTPSMLIDQGMYQFTWFRGNATFSFPSGHAVQIASIAAVLWQTNPGARILYAAATVAVLAALVLGNWHYFSDVVAGGFIGATSGLMIVSLWHTRNTNGRTG